MTPTFNGQCHGSTTRFVVQDLSSCHFHADRIVDPNASPTCSHVSQSIGIVVLLAFAASSTHSLEYAPGYGDFTFLVNGTWLIAPAFAHFGMDTWEPFVAETVMWYENFTGKAVVLEEMTHGRSPEATIKRTLKMGAAKGYGKPIAILSPSPAGIAGFGLIARDYSNMEWLKIPTVDISLPVYLLAKGLSEAHYPAKLGFVIRSDDSNAVGNSWSFGSVIVSAAFLASLCLCCFVVNIYKFQIHIRYASHSILHQLHLGNPKNRCPCP